MSSKSYKGFWDHLARIILRNRIGILILIVGFTLFLSTQWKYMRFSNTEANLLPDDHIENIIFNEFVEEFGGQENIIAIAVKDSALFELEKFNRWQRLSKQLRAMPEVKNVISTENVEELVRNRTENRFELEIIFKDEYSSQEQLDRDLRTLIDYQPFYEKLLYNRETRTVRSLIYIDDDILNTSVRKAFILEDLNRITTQFEEDTNIDLHISGMPYIRTMNAESIISEIGLFIGAALLVTSLIFFLFFRSYRATIISMSIVGVGVMWAFGILGLLEYEITVLTALIPPLIIVIGIPNCIFLINKYQNEVRNHGNQAKSLQRVITKIGNATLMTNLTTASGFATFIFTNSKLLKEFGIVASINIIGIFILSLLVIPIIYSFMGKPTK
jgi:predicted RND superfamily exporter protein